MRSRVRLFSIACLLLGGLSLQAPSLARAPSMDDIYSMIVDQHAMLQDQQKRIEALEQALGLQKQEISTLRVRATNAESELEQSRRELRSIVIPSGDRLAALPGQQLAVAAVAQVPPPERGPRFTATLEALYLTAFSDSFRYLSGQATGEGPQQVNQDFEPGAELRVAYALPNSAWSLGAGVRHLQGQSRERHVVTGNVTTLFDVGADANDVIDAQPGETVYAESKYKLWSVDLDARYGLDPRNQLGLVAGARYASLKRGLDVRDGGDYSDNEANFAGFGPKLGITGDFGLSGGFRAIGATSGSLLIGRGSVISLSNCGCGGADEYYSTQEVRAVPVFDGRLGLGYDYAPKGRQGFGLGFEGGLLGQHWMNLQDFVNQGSGQLLGVGTPMVADTTMTFFGPYLSMKMWW